MMFAIIKIGTSQHLVFPGQEILVSILSVPPDTKLSFDQVLLISNGDKVHIGQPYLAQAKVTAIPIAETKGAKIRVATYKAKSRYRKVKGFRPRYTKIQVDQIILNSNSPVKLSP